MPERLNSRELSEIIRKLVSSLVSTDGQISLSDKLSKELDKNGSRFLGVVVSNYPKECAEELKGTLKTSLRKCMLDGRVMWVHEEEVDGLYDGDEERFVRYRSSRPYNILLIYDPMNIVGRREGFYSIDFMAFLESEKMASVGSRADKLKS